MRWQVAQIQPLTTLTQVQQMMMEVVIMIWMMTGFWMLMRLMDVLILLLTIMIPWQQMTTELVIMT